jgi:hypothetical protein
VVDFVTTWTEKTEVAVERFVGWIGVSRGKFYAWKERYGKANEHNGKVPRDHWIEPWEHDRIIDFHGRHPLEGYRRLTFMMLDADEVAVSPSTTYRVLRGAGLLDRWKRGASSPSSSSTTTPCGSTARSAISRRRTSSPTAAKRSGPFATSASNRPELGGLNVEGRTAPHLTRVRMRELGRSVQ